MSRAGAARLKVLLTAALFSTGGAAIKECAMSGWQVAAFRSGIAAVAIFLMVPSVRRAFRPRTWLVGAAYAVTLVFFVNANKMTTAAHTIFLQSTAPVYLVLLSPLLLKEPVRRHDIQFIVALLLGMGLFLLEPSAGSASAPRPALGNAFAAISGFGWAFTVLGLRWLARDGSGGPGSAAAATVAGNAIAFFGCLPLALPVATPSAADVGWLAFLGIFQIALAYVLLTAGMREIPALEGSLLLLLEPVLNPVWAFALQGERPGRLALSGAALILAATVWHSVAASRSRAAP